MTGGLRALLAGAAVTLIQVTPAGALPWREEARLQPLFEKAGVEGTFVVLDERQGVWRGYNRLRAEQRFSPASTFKIPNSLIALSLGVVANPDELIPYKGDPNPFMREWLGVCCP